MPVEVDLTGCCKECYMPLHGGICEFDPEHTPLPQDLDDPQLADWFPSWLHNYRRRNMWPFAVFGPLPPVPPEDMRSAKLGSAVSFTFAPLAAVGQRSPGAAIWAGRPLCPSCLMPLQREWCSLDPSHDVSCPVFRDDAAACRPPPTATEDLISLPARGPEPPPPPPEERAAPPRPSARRPPPSVAQLPPEAGDLISALPTSVEDWLRGMDDLGFLAVYHDAIAGHFDSPAQVVDVYAAEAGGGGGGNGAGEVGGVAVRRFLDDMGVRKLGHRRLFEKWFAERFAAAAAAGTAR